MLVNARIGAIVVLLVAVCSAWTTALAATINVSSPEDGEPSVVSIEGRLEEADIKAFRQAVFNLDYAIVLLKSEGGDLEAAIGISKAIRLKGFSTLVVDAECVSGCALIWLSGERRFIGIGAQIGFHAAYTLTNDGPKTAGVGNALVGAFVASLGLSDEIIAFVTSAGPDEFKWLTPAVAEQIGLEISEVGDDERTQQAIDAFNAAVDLAAKGSAGERDAVRLYWRAAQAGFAGALNNLGDAYELGEGVPANEAFAVYWYARAAERGEPTAYYSLSTILAKGNPDNAQLVEAMKFAILAVNSLPGAVNRQGATEAKLSLEKRLTEKDVALAERLASEWQPLFQEKNIMGDP